MYGFRAEPATQIEILLFVIFLKSFCYNESQTALTTINEHKNP